MTTPIKLTVQIFAGEFNRLIVDFNLVWEKLAHLYRRNPIDRVIIGYYPDQNLYQKISDYVKPKGTKLYLWFPVFAELGSIKDFKPLVDWRGNEIRKNIEIKGTAGFEFYCPSNPQNLNNVKGIFEEHFSQVDFDGIFLDRIRYPSFSNGIRSIFTCFCTDCATKMAENGIAIPELQDKIEAVLKSPANVTNPLGIKSYHQMVYQFNDEIWEKFFRVKALIINNAIQDLTTYFVQKGLKTGLDVFAPFLGYFIGQRLDLLSKNAEFIKPMFYRATLAPAGLPYELNKYVEEFARGNMEVYNSITDHICGILGVNDYNGKLIPLEFVLKEIGSLFQTGVCNNTSLLPGIEINRIEDIAPIDPLYIHESVSALKKQSIDGIVLSWDLISMPEDNLEMLIKVLK